MLLPMLTSQTMTFMSMWNPDSCNILSNFIMLSATSKCADFHKKNRAERNPTQVVKMYGFSQYLCSVFNVLLLA